MDSSLCSKAITLSTSQVQAQAQVKFESGLNKKLFFFVISFDCDFCFHNDVPVVNSKIIKQSGRSINHQSWVSSKLRFVIRAMTSRSIYKFSWKNMTSVCIQLRKRSHFHNALSEKTDVNKYYRSHHSSTILLRPQGTPDIIQENLFLFLFGQNVGGHIVFQYFCGIRTLIFSLSMGFWGQIISSILEVFCLSWAIPVRRDASERNSLEALMMLKFTCR